MKQLNFHNEKFEKVVRNELLIYDRPITEADAILAYDLDCSEFTFNIEDCETLCAFKNLDWLSIKVGFDNLSFLKQLESLEELYVEFYQDNFDFTYLSHLKNLKSLTVSGGDLSDFNLHNFNALTQLPILDNIALHEFGTVDLSALKDMTQLTGFFCGYADKVENIDAISYLTNLDGLTLIDIKINNLDFLESLGNDSIINLTGVTVLEKVDINKFKRFKECSIEESFINDEKVSWRVYNGSI